MKILNIYGQEFWHTEAKIAGSKEALEALKEAIDCAIKNGKSAIENSEKEKEPLYASDGEGYAVEIYCLPSDFLDPAWKDWEPEYTGIKE